MVDWMVCSDSSDERCAISLSRALLYRFNFAPSHIDSAVPDPRSSLLVESSSRFFQAIIQQT
jgi:hypothetical protein